MFGFPENASDWTKKDYLRLFTVVILYIFLRPVIQKVYEKIGDRRVKREQKKTQEEQIRRHKQELIRDQLAGTSEENSSKKDALPNTSSARSSARRANRAARERVAKLEAERKDAAEKATVVDNDMPSDDDVSDLIG